jgi:hypothetical protein
MSGVAIVRYKLANYANLTAVVSAARIQAGVLPQNTALPAISVTLVSGMTGLQLANVSGLRTDRVQITVDAASYPQVRQILALCRAALPYTRGMVNSIPCDSILPDIEGPDGFDDLLKTYFQSQDFIVRWSA